MPPSAEAAADVLLDHDAALFEEPADFRPPPAKPTECVFARSDSSEIRLRLVGHHSLWAHVLWNAGVVMAEYLDARGGELVRGRRVLELGAAAGLPSIISALNGAERVVATDYPDKELLENIERNVEANIRERGNIQVVPHLWGSDTAPLVTADAPDFDLVLMADLIFNHTEHARMLASCKAVLSERGQVLVFFTHHRPWLAERDMRFFDAAREAGFAAEHLFAEQRAAPMFAADAGDETVRRTVHAWRLTLA